MFKRHPLKFKRRNNLSDKVVASQDSQALVVTSKEQYQLQIAQDTAVNPLRNRLSKWEQHIAATPFWKSALSSAAIVSTIFFAGLLIYFIFKFYDILPPKFPLIYSQTSNNWKTIDKELLPIAPVLIITILVFLTRFNYATYHFDSRLATMVNIAVLIFNSLGILAFMQLFSLLLLY